MFQLLDPGFVGLIFSCFSEDAQKVGMVELHIYDIFSSPVQRACAQCGLV
jgi:hypothetical protein